MRRWQKGVLWGGAGLTLLLAAGAFGLHVLADGDKLKQLARDKVSQSWGRELTVGDISVSLLPSPRLHATDVTISNPAWAQSKHLLEASGVTARFDLISLLSGNVVVKGLRIDSMKADLETNTDGVNNWTMPQAKEQSASAIDLTELHITNSLLVVRPVQGEGEGSTEEWRLEALHAEAGSTLRNVAFDARVRRNDQLLEVKGKLDDLSAIGKPGAMTQGVLDAKIGAAALSVKGGIPLDPASQCYAFTASIDVQSMQQAFAFFGLDERSPVPLKASATLQAEGHRLDVRKLTLQMGQLNLSGDGWLDRGGTRPVFNAKLQADRVDMVQTFLDAGRPPLPPKKPGQLFRDKPLSWPLLVALDGMDGRVDASIASLKLRSGIEVTDAAARLNIHDDRMSVPSFSGKLLDGSATGDAVFEGRRQSVDLNLKLSDTLLGRWFKETGKKVALSGGRTQLTMQVHASGPTMNDLAASMTGPIDIRIGDAKVLSQKAGQAEFWLTGLLSAKDADSIDLSCISARLPFRSGVARGEGIAGARSDASQLLTSGTVDMRSQTLDLHGRVRARSGVSLGWSSLGGNVKITGPLAKPEWRTDETGKVGTMARVGAAILTIGASIIVTSIWDGANPESDPCQVVFSPKAKAAKNAPARQPADQAMP